MKKPSKRFSHTTTLLGLLTVLIISCGIFSLLIADNSVQDLDTNSVALHTTAEDHTYAWNATWGGSASDYGVDAVLDSSGSIYCSGYSSNFGAGGEDHALVKFDANGVKVWNTTWGGTLNDRGRKVAMDSTGALYVIGETRSFGAGGSDLALLKFAPNGTKLWNTTWGGIGDEVAMDITVDGNDFIYCAGETGSWDLGDGDFVALKFASNGTKIWNVTWGGGDLDRAYGIAVDASGATYCAGHTQSFGVLSDELALVKFDTSGNQLWNTTWGGSGADIPYGVVLDASGNIYCSGFTENTGAGGEEIMLVKFSAAGTKLWNITWGGWTHDRGRGITMHNDGTIYVTGFTGSFGEGNADFVVIQFDTNGNQLWNTTWGTVSHDYCSGIAFDASGNLFLIGNSMGLGEGIHDFVLVKYSLPSAGGIPGFELLYLLAGFIALIFIVDRKKLN